MTGSRCLIALLALLTAQAAGVGEAAAATDAGGARPILLAGEESSPQTPADAIQRQRAEDLARAASERFSEIMAQEDAQNAAPAAAREPAGKAPADEALAPVWDWLARASDRYQDVIVRKLRNPSGEIATKAAAGAVAPGVPATETASPRQDVPEPKPALTWGGMIERAQDWLARANRSYRNEIVKKLVQPAPPEATRAIAEAPEGVTAATPGAPLPPPAAGEPGVAAVQPRTPEAPAVKAEPSPKAEPKSEKVDEKLKAEAEKRAADEAEADRKAEAERRAEEKRKAEAEAEARRKAEAERRAEEKRKAEAQAEARRKAEAEAKRLAEEAEAERKAVAEAEAKRMTVAGAEEPSKPAPSGQVPAEDRAAKSGAGAPAQAPPARVAPEARKAPTPELPVARSLEKKTAAVGKRVKKRAAHKHRGKRHAARAGAHKRKVALHRKRARVHGPGRKRYARQVRVRRPSPVSLRSWTRGCGEVFVYRRRPPPRWLRSEEVYVERPGHHAKGWRYRKVYRHKVRRPHLINRRLRRHMP